MPRRSEIRYSAAQFDELAARLEALRLVARPPLVDAVALVREGVVISAGDEPAAPPLPPGADVAVAAPNPYRLNQWVDDGGHWASVNDRIEIDVHGATSMTHLDTTEHFSWGDRRIPSPPAGALMDLARTGVVCRGILIDVPGALGASLDGGIVTLEDVRSTLQATGLALRAGDALYLRFGRTGTARSDVPLGSARTSGLSIECAEWLAEARPSIVVTDEGLDPHPSEVEGQAAPWHLLLLTVLGTPLVDRAMLAPLAATCRELRRWEFLSVVAPLPIPGASGSPVNPLAIF